MAMSFGSFVLHHRPSRTLISCSLPFCTASHSAKEWSGLQDWRASPVDERREWGPKNRCTIPSVMEPWSPDKLESHAPSSLAEWGAVVLNTPDPLLKTSITHHAFRLWHNREIPLGTARAPHQPARPQKPLLVPLKQVPDVKTSPLPRNAHALHILAHIELNAVDLAWDTVVRFSENSEVLGQQFFADFVHVADDESRHFRWCSQRLSELGFCYGDMPAHNVLVSEGQKSAASVMSRLAVVPMVQEARGLDAGPKLAERLIGCGDTRSASIVSQITEEELAHVAVGVSWFLTICETMGRDPSGTFKDLVRELNVELKGPFNHAARAKTGLLRNWYDPEHCCSSRVKESDSSTRTGAKQTQEQEMDGVSKREVWTKQSNSACLTEVYNRLEFIVAMEKNNAS